MKVQVFGKMLWMMTAKMIVFVFLSCFFIVPGILSLCDNAFTEIISFESPALDTKGVFMLSKELAAGHRKEIFLQILSALGNAFAVSATMVLLLKFLKVFLNVPLEMYLIFAPLAFFIAAFFIAQVSMTKIFMRIKNEKTLALKV